MIDASFPKYFHCDHLHSPLNPGHYHDDENDKQRICWTKNQENKPKSNSRNTNYFYSAIITKSPSCSVDDFNKSFHFLCQICFSDFPFFFYRFCFLLPMLQLFRFDILLNYKYDYCSCCLFNPFRWFVDGDEYTHVFAFAFLFGTIELAIAGTSSDSVSRSLFA